MKQTDFWQQVDQRVLENRQIVQGGLPRSWAFVMEWVGLRFWQVGFCLSLIVSSWIFVVHYAELMKVIRWMVWR